MLEWLRKNRRDPPRAVDLAVDPVCGMEIAPASAAATRMAGGRTLHFCSLACADKFDRNATDAAHGSHAGCC